MQLYAEKVACIFTVEPLSGRFDGVEHNNKQKDREQSMDWKVSCCNNGCDTV